MKNTLKNEKKNTAIISLIETCLVGGQDVKLGGTSLHLLGPLILTKYTSLTPGARQATLGYDNLGFDLTKILRGRSSVMPSHPRLYRHTQGSYHRAQVAN